MAYQLAHLLEGAADAPVHALPEELILLAHPTFGLLAVLAALWVLVEALNANEAGAARLKAAAVAAAAFMWLAYLFGGYWYITEYQSDIALILEGPWPFAETFFMKVKRHLFLSLLLLATYLPVLAFAHPVPTARGVRALVVSTAGLVIALGLAIEGVGAIISTAEKLSLAALLSLRAL